MDKVAILSVRSLHGGFIMISKQVDVAIIGAGTAGMSAYREVRKFTDSIALIEAGSFGTTCARVGCMPAELLVAPGEARRRLQALPEFGISVGPGQVDGAAVMQRFSRTPMRTQIHEHHARFTS